MTRGQIRTAVLAWLDDPNGLYFDATTVNNWINLAQRQVQMELLQAGENWYMKPVESLTVIGQADYILPSDFMVENRLEVVLSGSGTTENRLALDAITTNQQDLISINLGQPTNYYIKKDRVTLSPTPQQAYLLRLYYSYMVADLNSDSDVPDVPEQFMEMVSLFAAFNGYIKDDRVPNNLMAKKEEFKLIMRQMSEDRTQDKSRQVVQTDSYDFGTFW